ncbi:YciI family protein [Lacisediminihabitans sp.]|uniref:YciI family protein n=1 Tax=Lacisediminihabitans sp. TaxID=2787631 RepID=UPI00374CF665
MSDKYLILIVEPTWDPASVPEGALEEASQAHGAFAAAVAAAGAKILGGEALQPASASVRITPARDGKPAVFTNGPLAETTEVLSGYYLIEADSLEQAKQLAALCPTGDRLELHPIWDLPGM